MLTRRSKDHSVLLSAPADCTALVHEFACVLAHDEEPEVLAGLRLYSFDVALSRPGRGTGPNWRSG